MREKNAYFTLRQESELGARCGASDDPARVKTTGNRGATRGRKRTRTQEFKLEATEQGRLHGSGSVEVRHVVPLAAGQGAS